MKMNKILDLFLLLFFFSATKVESQEVCESYIYNWQIYKPQNCSDYCCGSSCDNRYCCNDLKYRLDQNLCIQENCTGYYQYGYYLPPVDCSHKFCCGYCHQRYCCTSPGSRLNQSECSTEKPATKIEISTILYYVIGGSCILLIICCLLFACRDRNIRLRRRLQTTTNNNTDTVSNAQSNTRSAFVVADNSAYNYDINKIYNTNMNINDDLPPTYDTIVNGQHKTDETAETTF